MSFKIVKNLTPYNYTDRNDTSRIMYIVVHYFGSLGSAKGVANYFASEYRGASAHYSLDEGEEIYQSVDDGDIAWHCGTSGKYYHPDCRNSNSIGIEVKPYKRDTTTVLATDKDWYFTDKTIDRLVDFTKYLMKKYNIPADRVIRHYDVTRKICPNPFVLDAAAWDAFKKRLEPYKVRVTVSALNIRSGPGAQHDIKGVIKDKGVYTIVDTSGKWGKLKSGAGWIHLDYTLNL